MKVKVLIGILLLALFVVSYSWFENWVILGYTEGSLETKEKEVNDLRLLVGKTLSPEQIIVAAEKNGMFVSRNTDGRFLQSKDAKLAVVVESTTFYFDEDNNYIPFQTDKTKNE